MAAQAAPLAPGPSNGNARLEAALGQELRSLREASEATSPVDLENQAKLPGASPAVTVERGLLRTGQAEATLRRAVAQGLVEPGWFFSGPVNNAATGAIDTMLQATQSLDLSEVPKALNRA